MRALRLLPLLLALGLLVVPVEIMEAQCVMCKAVAEDSAAEGAVGRGINNNSPDLHVYWRLCRVNHLRH